MVLLEEKLDIPILDSVFIKFQKGLSFYSKVINAFNFWILLNTFDPILHMIKQAKLSFNNYERIPFIIICACNLYHFTKVGLPFGIYYDDINSSVCKLNEPQCHAAIQICRSKPKHHPGLDQSLQFDSTSLEFYLFFFHSKII